MAELILWVVGRVCTTPSECAVVSDLGAHVEAARRAGGHGILVPSGRTRPEGTAGAEHVVPDVLTAVRTVLNGPPRGRVLVDERPMEAAFDTGPRPR
ncbi:HAD hydrolase-like protein [Streptomyces sp. Root369]|uniref:HAD hydrolase-like protein n=1 Tax=Streptomyces sp. Root369 TaxID=1736523 RepID=UPI000A6AB95C|nr:HAD hydrolase-like protein [Streptomyces sp. Root369]